MKTFQLSQITVSLLIFLLLQLCPSMARRRHGRRSSPSSSTVCEEVQVAMCKGLVPYNRTKLPNRFGHRTQADVYWALQPWWPFMDAGCSNNLRNFLCGLYLPSCVSDTSAPEYPCMETCKKAKVRCKKQMRVQQWRWSKQFQCKRLLPKSSGRCIKPERERRKAKFHNYVLCAVNKLSMCQGMAYTQGSLPNMFLQGDLWLIDREMQQFQPLVDSGCSKKLRLFLCGVYMPFCLPGTQVEKKESTGGVSHSVIESFPDLPFAVPCRELCQEVYDQCSGEYGQRTHGLPWPGKFHCHRYPSYADRYGAADSTNLGLNSVPCTMLPYTYDGN